MRAWELPPLDPETMDDFGCAELARAIVRQAAEDYYYLLKYKGDVRNIEKFVDGPFFEILTDIHPEAFKKIIRKKVKDRDEFMSYRIRRNKGLYSPSMTDSHRFFLGRLIGKENVLKGVYR